MTKEDLDLLRLYCRSAVLNRGAAQFKLSDIHAEVSTSTGFAIELAPFLLLVWQPSRDALRLDGFAYKCLRGQGAYVLAPERASSQGNSFRKKSFRALERSVHSYQIAVNNSNEDAHADATRRKLGEVQRVGGALSALIQRRKDDAPLG